MNNGIFAGFGTGLSERAAPLLPWQVVANNLIMKPGGRYLVDGATSSGDNDYASVAALISLDSNLSDATGNVWTASGSFGVSSAQSQFGGSSGLWSSNTDAASTPSVAKFNMPGDFCIDFWWWKASSTPTSDMVGRGAGASASQWIIYTTAAGALIWYASSTDVLNTGTMAAQTWHAIRFNRSAGTLAAYVNGTRVGTVADSRDYTNTSVLEFGRVVGVNNPNLSHIDEFRLTVGTARETGSSYTPSTTAFPRFSSSADVIVPLVITPGDEFIVHCSAVGARIVPGAVRRIGVASVGANVTLTPGQSAWMVARSPTQLDLIA